MASFKDEILSEIITDLLGHDHYNFAPQYLYLGGAKVSHKETCYSCGNTIRTGSFAAAQLIIDEFGMIIGVAFAHNQDWATPTRYWRNCRTSSYFFQLKRKNELHSDYRESPDFYMNQIDVKFQEALELM